MNKTCVCLICYKPNYVWVEFLSKFTKYDVYIIVDDNSKDYKEQYCKFTNVNIIQINNHDCRKNGFVDMNFTIAKEISSWEKSMYYFSTINTEYNKVWFFEDDVFFNDEGSLLRIDAQYENSDLLSNHYVENVSGEKNSWHWHRININFSPPFYTGMMCCVRISSNLLFKLKKYANENNTLFFLEALFPTICKKYNLQYDTPSEFKHIYYRKDFIETDINENNLYHPIKDIDKHSYYRGLIIKNKKLTYI